MDIRPAPDSYDPHLVDESSATTGYRVLGAAGVLLAMFALVSIPFAILPFYRVAWTVQPLEQSHLNVWMLFSALAGTGLSILLLAAATGCLSLRPWSRKGLILYAILSLILSAFNLVFYRHYLLPGPHVTAQEVGAFGTFMLLLIWPFTVAYSIAVLYYFTRHSTRQLFEEGPALT